MPNLCTNKMRVVGPKCSVDAFVLRVMGLRQSYDGERSKRTEVLNFQSVKPVPAGLLLRSYTAAQELKDNPGLEKIDGVQSGLDWESKYWGCKWGALDTRYVRIDGETAYYEFDTASIPPFELMESMAQLPEVKGLRILLDYLDEFMIFGGYLNIEYGEFQCEYINPLSEAWILKFLSIDGTPGGNQEVLNAGSLAPFISGYDPVLEEKIAKEPTF